MKTLSKSSKSVGIRLDHDRKLSVREVRLKWLSVLLTVFLISIALRGIGLCDGKDKASDITEGGEHQATLVPDLKATATDKDVLFPLRVILKSVEKKDHCLRNAQIMYPYHGKEGFKKVPVKISLKKGIGSASKASASKASEKKISKGKASVISPITRSSIEINAEMVNEDEFIAFKKGLPQEKRIEVDRGLSPGRYWISFIMEDPEEPGTCMEVIITLTGFEHKK